MENISNCAEVTMWRSLSIFTVQTPTLLSLSIQIVRLWFKCGKLLVMVESLRSSENHGSPSSCWVIFPLLVQIQQKTDELWSMTYKVISTTSPKKPCSKDIKSMFSKASLQMMKARELLGHCNSSIQDQNGHFTLFSCCSSLLQAIFPQKCLFSSLLTDTFLEITKK